MVLQDRDEQLLIALSRFRYLTSEHVAWLFFEGRSRRAAQARLRRLWEHGLVERTFVPLAFRNTGAALLNRPIYSLGRRGLEHLAGRGASARQVTGGGSYRNLEHHLVATDFLVAFEAALRRATVATLVSTEPEAALVQKLRAWRRTGGQGDAVLSDGAFTLKRAQNGEPSTFHIEVVRADVRGGSKQLFHKLNRYVHLHRAGFFARAYGHVRVRAVIITTPTAARAENLRQLAARMPHGRRFAWFTSYEEETGGGAPRTSLRPETILTARFVDAEGSTFTLGARNTALPGPSTTPTHQPSIHAI
jgi:hypothetical protein